MEEHQLNILIENKLYRYILALSDDKLDNITVDTIEEGILWFLLQYESKITKSQKLLIRQKVWQMFYNKSKNLSKMAIEEYDKQTKEIDDLEI